MITRVLLGHVSVQHGNDSSTCEVSLLLVAILGPTAGRMIKYWQAVAVQLLAFTLQELKHAPASECTCYCGEVDKEEQEIKGSSRWAITGSFAAGGTLATCGCFTLS